MSWTTSGGGWGPPPFSQVMLGAEIIATTVRAIARLNQRTTNPRPQQLEYINNINNINTTQECGGKMYMGERDYDHAIQSFFQVRC